MFSLRIINSARFLKMPIDSQVLYFHLGMNADDDGVVEAYPVMRMLGNTEDNLKVLVAKNFVKILNEDLVSLISDWTEHNLIRADRKVDSIYKDLLLQIVPDIQLIEPKPRADTGVKPRQANWTATGRQLDGIGKDRLGKEKKDNESDKSPHHSLISFFYEQTEKIRGFKPEISEKDAGLLAVRLKKYAPEQIKDLIVWYLESKDCDRLGATLSICLSSAIINKFKEENLIK